MPVLARAEDAETEELKPPKTYHATAFVRSRMGIRVIDYWSKGAEMKARTLIAGHAITTIVRGDRYIALDELSGRGFDIARSKEALAEDLGRARPFAFELDEMRGDGAEKIEDVKIGSMDGEIWRVTDTAGRRKLWVTSQEPKVPLRIETFSRASADTINLDYSNWIFDLEMTPGFFATPSNFELQRFEYDEFLEKSIAGEVDTRTILYLDLLHGTPPG